MTPPTTPATGVEQALQKAIEDPTPCERAAFLKGWKFALASAPAAPQPQGSEPTEAMCMAMVRELFTKDRQPGEAWEDVMRRCYRAALAQPAAHQEDAATPAKRELNSDQIRKGWEATFSTDNPYCPCDLKSFTKAVRWAERAIASSGGKAA